MKLSARIHNRISALAYRAGQRVGKWCMRHHHDVYSRSFTRSFASGIGDQVYHEESKRAHNKYGFGRHMSKALELEKLQFLLENAPPEAARVLNELNEMEMRAVTDLAIPINQVRLRLGMHKDPRFM